MRHFLPSTPPSPRPPKLWRRRLYPSIVLIALLASPLSAYHVRFEPSLMGPTFIADTYTTEGWGNYPYHNQALRLGKATRTVTCITWTHLGNASSYAQASPHIYPQAAFAATAPCDTFLGPESGSGTKTWTAAIPTRLLPGTETPLDIVAYNLTCSAETTLTFDGGKTTTTLPAGTTLGKQAYATPGGDILLTTAGTWEIEVAWPQAVAIFYSLYDTNVTTSLAFPTILADQWGCVAADFSFDAEDQVVVGYRTYYPYGCAVTNSVGALRMTTTPAPFIGRTTFQRGDCFVPFSISAYGGYKDATDKSWSYQAYGPKLWPRALSEAEIRQVVQKDAAIMLARGILTPEDLHPGAHTEAASAKARTRQTTTHTHFPGEPPPIKLEE